MQMDGRHLEEALAARPAEVGNLNDHAQHFCERDDADHQQHGPLTGHKCDDRQHGAQRHRAGIAHDELRRVDVEP